MEEAEKRPVPHIGPAVDEVRAADQEGLQHAALAQWGRELLRCVKERLADAEGKGLSVSQLIEDVIEPVEAVLQERRTGGLLAACVELQGELDASRRERAAIERELAEIRERADRKPRAV